MGGHSNSLSYMNYYCQTRMWEISARTLKTHSIVQIQQSRLWAQERKGWWSGMVSSKCKHLTKLFPSLSLCVCACVWVCQGTPTLWSSFSPPTFMHIPLRLLGLQHKHLYLLSHLTGPATATFLWGQPNLTHLWHTAKQTVSQLLYSFPLIHVSLFLNILTFIFIQNVSAFALSSFSDVQPPQPVSESCKQASLTAHSTHPTLKKKKIDPAKSSPHFLLLFSLHHNDILNTADITTVLPLFAYKNACFLTVVSHCELCCVHFHLVYSSESPINCNHHLVHIGTWGIGSRIAIPRYQNLQIAA